MDGAPTRVEGQRCFAVAVVSFSLKQKKPRSGKRPWELS